jgi:hypothetical protein
VNSTISSNRIYKLEDISSKLSSITVSSDPFSSKPHYKYLSLNSSLTSSSYPFLWLLSDRFANYFLNKIFPYLNQMFELPKILQPLQDFTHINISKQASTKFSSVRRICIYCTRSRTTKNLISLIEFISQNCLRFQSYSWYTMNDM